MSKLAKFYVAMGLGVDFRAGKFAQMITTVGLTLNNDWKAYDSFFNIGRLLARSRV